MHKRYTDWKHWNLQFTKEKIKKNITLKDFCKEHGLNYRTALNNMKVTKAVKSRDKIAELKNIEYLATIQSKEIQKSRQEAVKDFEFCEEVMQRAVAIRNEILKRTDELEQANIIDLLKIFLLFAKYDIEYERLLIEKTRASINEQSPDETNLFIEDFLHAVKQPI